MFVNIFNHSYYSLLDSIISIDNLIQHALDNNHQACVLTDTNLYGAREFYNKCLKANIKPVIGLNFLFNQKTYLLIAKNNNGFQNLVKLTSFQKIEKDFEMNKYLDDLYVIYFDKENAKDLNADAIFYEDLALSEVKYLYKNDKKQYYFLNAINHEIVLENNQIDYQNRVDFHYLTSLEAAENFSSKQLSLTSKIISECNWTIAHNKKMHFPQFDKKYNSCDVLKNLCVSGLKKRFGSADGLIEEQYVKRLSHELEIITQMGYEDYFLVVYDFVNYAKKNGIMVGPGRGSAAGSLVSYSLYITDIDPIKYNLLFERFLNVDRQNLPDIDIDIMDDRRQEVIDYIFDKYGPENTSYIITFQRMKIKLALRDVGRVLNIPLPIIDKICKLVPLTYDKKTILDEIKQNPQLIDLYNSYPDLFEISTRFLDLPRQFSTHAAGIIIADKPIYEYAPIQIGLDGWHLSQYSMEYLESLGLIKIDILGLKNLSIISDTLKLITTHKKTNLDINTISLTDSTVYKQIALANTVGIFQLESPGMRTTLRKIKPSCLEDISIVSALFRPGPQMFINDYAKTKNKEIEEKYINDDLKQILKPTLGFCIYQEQVIALIRAVANFSLSEADIFRRAISKKQENVFDQMRQKFLDNAIANNYDKKQAEQIYEFILKFANYGFNHSHSLSYAKISYQMMYLKIYYPLEFIMTLLEHMDSTNAKNNIYITELKKNKIPIYNVSITKSKMNFSIYNNGVIFGFTNIKGFGLETAKKIYKAMLEYNGNNFLDATNCLKAHNISEKVIETLISIGAFDEFDLDRNYMLENFLNKEELIADGVMIFSKSNDNTFEPMSEKLKQELELKYLSYSFSNNIWDQLNQKYVNEYKLKNIDPEVNGVINTLVRVDNIKKRKTKYNTDMLFIDLENNNLTYSCAVFGEKFNDVFENNTFYILQLKINNSRLSVVDIVCPIKTDL